MWVFFLKTTTRSSSSRSNNPAHLFMNNAFFKLGFPNEIIGDWGSNFVPPLWTSLFSDLTIQQKSSKATRKMTTRSIVSTNPLNSTFKVTQYINRKTGHPGYPLLDFPKKFPTALPQACLPSSHCTINNPNLRTSRPRNHPTLPTPTSTICPLSRFSSSVTSKSHRHVTRILWIVIVQNLHLSKLETVYVSRLRTYIQHIQHVNSPKKKLSPFKLATCVRQPTFQLSLFLW